MKPKNKSKKESKGSLVMYALFCKGIDNPVKAWYFKGSKKSKQVEMKPKDAMYAISLFIQYLAFLGYTPKNFMRDEREFGFEWVKQSDLPTISSGVN